MILRESVPSRAPVRALFGVVLLALIALPGFSDGQPAPQDPARTKTAPDTTDAVPYRVELTQPATKAPGDAEREQRLRKLEASLEALLKEVKELRGADAKPKTEWKTEVREIQNVPMTIERWTKVAPATKPAPSPEHPLHLVRTTYTLPKDKADALAALLKDLKAPVLEIQAKADGVVVTTTPEADRVIGEFVGLLQGKVPPAAPKSGNNYYPQAK